MRRNRLWGRNSRETGWLTWNYFKVKYSAQNERPATGSLRRRSQALVLANGRQDDAGPPIAPSNRGRAVRRIVVACWLPDSLVKEQIMKVLLAIDRVTAQRRGGRSGGAEALAGGH